MTPSSAGSPGRNEICRCGSGRKYKQCCLPKDEATAADARALAAAEAPAPVAEAVPSTSARPPKPQTPQPWKATASRGFARRTRTPRKMGGG
ncbi:hypothetical protein BH24ACI4_BH24ACI4_09550 [soil metagenome]